MTSLEIHHETASNNETVAFCLDPDDAALGRAPYGNSIVKLSEMAVVKCGVAVREEEKNNQRRAYELVDHSIVRVPFVYQVFTQGGLGYIVMECMQVRVLKPIEYLSLIDRIAYVFAHLAKVHSSIPGEIGGGKSHGIFWSKDDEPSLQTIKDLKTWFNRRLLKQDHKLVLGGSGLVLCHLDIAL